MLYTTVLAGYIYKSNYGVQNHHLVYIDTQTNHQSALETQGTLSQCNHTIQATAAATSYGNHVHVPRVESGQHEAMLFG